MSEASHSHDEHSGHEEPNGERHDHNHEGHDHDHGGAGHVHGATSGPMLWISLIITMAFVIGEYIAGRKANSLALISDAGHNLSDALALGLAAYAVWIARKPANARKTYGYHRVSILTALFNAVMLIVIGIFILVEAYHLFRTPEPVNGTLMLWVAAVAVLMNTVIAYLLRGGAKESMNNARRLRPHGGRRAFLSGRLDCRAGRPCHSAGDLADPTVSVLIAVFIIYSSWGIVREATEVLMEGTPKDLDTVAIVAAMGRVSHVHAVHDLHTWTVSDGMNYLSCHVVVDEHLHYAQLRSRPARHQSSARRQFRDRPCHDPDRNQANVRTERPNAAPLFCPRLSGIRIVRRNHPCHSIHEQTTCKQHCL